MLCRILTSEVRGSEAVWTRVQCLLDPRAGRNLVARAGVADTSVECRDIMTAHKGTKTCPLTH